MKKRNVIWFLFLLIFVSSVLVAEQIPREKEEYLQLLNAKKQNELYTQEKAISSPIEVIHHEVDPRMTTLAPKDITFNADNRLRNPGLLRDPDFDGYGYNAYDPSGMYANGPIYFPGDNPGDITLLQPTTSVDFIAGGCWVTPEETWYGSQYGGGLYTIDEVTGDMVFIGDTGGTTLQGIEYDDASGVMYGTDGSSLYTVDWTTGAITLVGSHNVGFTMIGIAGDGAGNMWGVTVDFTEVSDLYLIDLATGNATSLGSTGGQLLYAQDLAYDHVNDVLYSAAYFGDGTPPGLYEIDTATAGMTWWGDFAGGMEVTGFAIPGMTQLEYCDSFWNNDTDDWITNVTFNTINNDTGQEGGPLSYGDYTYISTDITIGMTYDFYMTWESGSWTQYGTVWFDWNQDGDFYDAGEEFQIGSGASVTVTGPITVPFDAALGATRMRVSERWSTWPQPCNDDGATYGETEDYTVVIGGVVPDPGYIEGTVTLNGGTGDVEDVMITAGGETVYPNAAGFYSIELLPGTYDLDATLEGYFPYSYEGIVVDEALVTVHDFTLDAIVPGELPIMETFDEGIPVTWTIEDGFSDGVTWMGVDQPPGIDGTPFAYVDSDANIGVHLMEGLVSPWFDGTGAGAILLEFDHVYDDVSTDDYAAVDVWDGSSWVNLVTFNEDLGDWGAPEHVELDLTPYANPAMQVRFFYDDMDSWAWWWGIDNVHIYEPLFGTVSGTVTEFGTGTPLEDIHIMIGEYEGFTDASGYYEITPVLVGTYTVYAQSDYYIDAEEPGVVVTDGGNTVVDFELLYAMITVDPVNFMVNVAEGNTLDQSMIIHNDGGVAPLDYACSFVPNNARTIPMEFETPKEIIQHEVDPRMTGLAPEMEFNAGNNMNNLPFRDPMFDGYGYNAYDPSGMYANGPIYFPGDNPGDITLLAPTTSTDFIAGGCWVAAENTWFGCQYGDGLYQIDHETGAMTYIGPTGVGLQGIEFDESTGMMYGTDGTSLYTVDWTTGATTMIGSHNVGFTMIGIAGDGAGNLWGVTVDFTAISDLYLIDLNTGNATSLGSTGGQLLYAQDLAFDKSNQILYLAAYFGDGTPPGLYEIDTGTAAMTWWGDFAGGMEVTGFAIPGESWVSFDPQAGTIDPDQQQVVTVTFDATNFVAGEIKEGTIHVANNANYMRGDDYLIPVTMIVVSDSNDPNDLPLATRIVGNYPNPFNPITTIAYQLKEDSKVDLSVYNIRGEKVTTLVNDQQAAGNHEVIWNGTDANGRDVSSGIYFYKMKTGRYTSTKKMILMK